MTKPTASGRSPASKALDGRVLLHLGAADLNGNYISQLPVRRSGVAVTGKTDFGAISMLRRRYPNLLLMSEPDVDKNVLATPTNPFALPADDLFGQWTLNRVADDQLEAGATCALLPTGRIQVGDDAALKAAVNAANELNRDDVVLRLPCEAAWLKPNWSSQLTAVLKRSAHPIALSFAHTNDPFESRGSVEAIRRMTAEVPHLILWRVDLAGIAHLAEGGLAACIGLLPSQRHGLMPGGFAAAINKTDRAPTVLVRDWLRYCRTSFLQDLYATIPPPGCDCGVCGGRALDRFSGSSADRAEGHAHNVEMLVELIGELQNLKTREDGRAWWREQVRQALAAHRNSSRILRRDLAPHPALDAWGRLESIAV